MFAIWSGEEVEDARTGPAFVLKTYRTGLTHQSARTCTNVRSVALGFESHYADFGTRQTIAY
jgi:hypothetical protein